jgi:hypothetical protein
MGSRTRVVDFDARLLPDAASARADNRAIGGAEEDRLGFVI